MPTGGMPTSENCLARAECRPWLGGMPTGCNADWAQSRIADYSHYEKAIILQSQVIILPHFS